MKSKIILCLLLISSFSFVSCSDDDSSSNNSNSQFEDKWWYSPDNSTLDVIFNSDGTYESTFVYQGNTMNSDGEWEWVDESAKKFRVFNLNGNAVSDFHGQAVNLTDDTVGIKMSLDEGETYTEPVPYVDTND